MLSVRVYLRETEPMRDMYRKMDYKESAYVIMGGS